ncbi:virion morphogenesis protein [Gemmobacter nanjingensis]|uniref:Virion morphogenesis protein n=1 Tax=Gemmobacter nanjingensis TaxID=488454 RepID=A0ABQ3FGC2_9RHOB|nr:phage virion morphogenesis protein [Gemmobacter nanjingensis]GHC22310.1 virion morphogenesis protein [Gemmobacter nanjingensis]
MAFTMIVTINETEASRVFSGLRDALSDMTVLMDNMGRVLVSSARSRIDTTNRAPDGSLWPQSQRAREHGGKTLYETGLLLGSINAWAGTDHVMVGSNAPYARIHQEGAEQGQFGARAGRTRPSTKRPKSQDYFFMLPWGDIPARPYIGLSQDDEATVVELAEAHFSDIVAGLQ